MALVIDTSNDNYRWATSEYWYNHPVTITINNTGSDAVRLGGLRLHMTACNARHNDGIYYIDVIVSDPWWCAGQSGQFALYEYGNTANRLSNIVTIPEMSKYNLVTQSATDGSEDYPFDSEQTWFLPRYRKGQGAQWGATKAGDNITESDYNAAFHDFLLTSPITVPAGGSVNLTLGIYSGWGVYQLSDLINAEPLPTFNITYKPNGGNWSGSTADVVHEVTKGGNDTLPAAPTRAGFNFTGWSPSGAPPTNVQSNHTYTAQWQPATSTVTFYRNSTATDSQNNSGTGQIGAQVGSDDNTISNDISINNATYHNRLRELVEANIAQDEAVGGACNGYQFWHWRRDRQYNKIRSSESPNYINISQRHIYASSDDNKFYAVWKTKSGDVHFYQNYDTTDTQEVPGSPVTGVDYILDKLGDKKPTDPTRVGYRFLGWSLSRDGGIVSDDTVLWNIATGQARDCFYAIWEKIYTIWVVETYDDNGTTRKRWVKKRNAHQVVLEGQTKSWVDVLPKIVTPNGQTKQWENDT